HEHSEYIDSLEKNVQVEPINRPHSIRYQWFLDPRDLYLSQKMVTNQWGQKRIKAYAREWGQLYLMPNNNGSTPYEVCWRDLRDYSGKGVVAVLSNKGKEQLQKHLNVNKHLAVRSHTIFRVERDDKFFPNAGEQVHEDHHYVVLPYFEVEEVL
ncbi:MAG: hypothetical protein ACYTXF_31735, partial [Nostoc sp.]